MPLQFPTLPDLPEGPFSTVVVDPPWAYDDDLPGPGRGANSHYDVLHSGTVAGMGPQVRAATTSSAHLWLWTTNSFLREAFEVVEAWGFDRKTVLTWVKVQNEPEDLPHERAGGVEVEDRLGMGHYLRNTTEHVLFATKGNRSTARNDVRTHFFAERTDHSTKPEKFYRLVEATSPPDYLDLFARRPRDGWTVWGDESDS